MQSTYSIKLYGKAWVGVKALQKNGEPEAVIVWTRFLRDAAVFSSKEVAAEFIETHQLKSAVVKGRQPE